MTTGTGIAGAANYHPATDDPEPTCFICGGSLRGGFAARVLPPMVQVCSAACAADPRYAKPKGRTNPR